MKTIDEIAREIGAELHAGQFREDKITPYFEGHCVKVAEIVHETNSWQAWEIPIVKSIAYLHDVSEDCGMTISQLKDKFVEKYKNCEIDYYSQPLDKYGYFETVDTILRSVKLLTKDKNLDYLGNILKIVKSGDMNAIRVKIADNTHNLSDLPAGARRDKYRLSRYILTHAKIN
jgi:(p)ppGpp synthase/HD superfamily hydrolase